MVKFLGSQVPYPTKAFSPYDLEPIHDRCINCEARKKIIATITIDKRTEPICVKCFKSYQE